MHLSVIVPLEVSRGTRIVVQVDSQYPYTVLYDKSAPPGKRVVAVIDTDEPVLTVPHAVDVRTLLVIGSVDAQAWQVTLEALDHGIDDGPPSTATDGRARMS